MKFVLSSKKNKDKSLEIFQTLLLRPPQICGCAMPRIQEDKQKVKILNKTTVLCFSVLFISLGTSACTSGFEEVIKLKNKIFPKKHVSD